MRLPDFLAIGALKAGTTYLDSMLRDHPDLCLPATVKEWSSSLATTTVGPPGTRDGSQDAARAGWARSRLSSWATVVARARIHELLPQARLLVSLRDPGSASLLAVQALGASIRLRRRLR